MQYDTTTLLPEQYDSAIIGVDISSAKFVYDVDLLQKIIENNKKVDDVVLYMDKNFFSSENKPIFYCKLNQNDAKQNLKLISFIRNLRH